MYQVKLLLTLLLFFLSTVFIAGCEQQETVLIESSPGVSDQQEEVSAIDESVSQSIENSDVNAREIDWDALIPEDWQPETLFEQYDVDELSDDDPRAQELLEKLLALWKEAPVVPTLEGQRLKLPGFVVPLEMDVEKIDQFLLVPYYGACIHVPPPPANQTVHVVTGEGRAFEGQLFDTVWVSGTMRVEKLDSELATSGYRLEDAVVVPYE